jgi:hypothetical protein
VTRARALGEQIAAALGGVAAGEARRWVDAVRQLSVVVAADDREAVRRRFAALPEIVALLDDDIWRNETSLSGGGWS